MDLVINGNELEALYGLAHFHQLTYLRGIRPYMDLQTGIVGVKRGISYQSIAEQLEIAANPGIKGCQYSRDQIKRALAALGRVGLIINRSEDFKLILECPIATKSYFVQNKAALNPPRQAALFNKTQSTESKAFFDEITDKPALNPPGKAAPPLYSNNNYIFLLGQHFEQFWALYPIKHAKHRAWELFQSINPSAALITQIIDALHQQLQHEQQQRALGRWVPNWKNPANWLAQRCWNDVISNEQQLPEVHHEKNQHHPRKQPISDPLWDACKGGLEPAQNGCEDKVIDFSNYRKRS